MSSDFMSFADAFGEAGVRADVLKNPWFNRVVGYGGDAVLLLSLLAIATGLLESVALGLYMTSVSILLFQAALALTRLLVIRLRGSGR